MASRSRRLAELLVGGAFFAWGCAHCAARGHSMLAVVGVALGAISHAMHAGEYVDGLGRWQDVRARASARHYLYCVGCCSRERARTLRSRSARQSGARSLV